MADIFISYSSKDRPRVARLAAALAKTGWSIWWDPVIPPGKVYDLVIEEQVRDARCILVCWSASSVNSTWVRAEAGEALNRGILIPAMLEMLDLPLVFRQVNAANLIDWSGDEEDERYQRLLVALAAKLGDPPNLDLPSLADREHIPGSVETRTNVSFFTPAANRKPASVFETMRSHFPFVVAVLVVLAGLAWAGITWQQSATQKATAKLKEEQRLAGLQLDLPQLEGTWETDYGVASLRQLADQVEGTILYLNGNRGEFRGLLKPHETGKYYTLDYNWKNGADFGKGVLDIQPGKHNTLRGFWEDQRGTRGKWVWNRATANAAQDGTGGETGKDALKTSTALATRGASTLLLPDGEYQTNLSKISFLCARDATCVGVYPGEVDKQQAHIYGQISPDGVMTGTWVETKSDHGCTATFRDSAYWGKLIFRFDPGRERWQGRWGYCDAKPDFSSNRKVWNGWR